MQGMAPAMWAIRSRSSFADCARAHGLKASKCVLNQQKGAPPSRGRSFTQVTMRGIDGAPPAAARLLRGGAEPEVSAVEQLEAGGLEEHAAHFAATFSIAAPDAAEGVIAELLTQEGLHRVQAFLRAEQVGVEGADPLHDQGRAGGPRYSARRGWCGRGG